MNRLELKEYIIQTYSAEPDYPWIRYPDYEIFRHNNRKWFALIMDVSKAKLGLRENEIVSIVNFKCDPILVSSLCSKPGFFPAYHMNKESWISVALDGSASDDNIRMLLDMSFDLTNAK